MKKFYIVMSGLLMQAMALMGQTYLAPEQGYRVADFLAGFTPVRAFDVRGDQVYIQDGDSVHVVNARTGEELWTYGEPADYQVNNYPSFLTISPDGKSIWAGYTSDGNVDDRIYRIDAERGEWNLQAIFPGNYDLIFWNESILVSGLNSTAWGGPNGIYLLDTSGMDQHRLIVEVGGNSAGMALDTMNNLYYGTSYSVETNGIYRWDSIDLEVVLGSEAAPPLQIADGHKLTDVPAGVSDCEIDEGSNLIITLNPFGSPKVLALFNGSIPGGDGYQLDTLAVAAGDWDWLGSVKSMGDFTMPYIGERLLTFSFGQSLVDLHTANYPPVAVGKLPVFSGYENEAIDSLDLTQFVTDPDDEDLFTFQIEGVSDSAVVDLHIEGNQLMGTYGAVGQTNVRLVAAIDELGIELQTTVGSWPRIDGDSMVSDMEEFSLEEESNWNGSDGSGSFISGSARFHNNYNPEWDSWSGWAYSNVTDNTIPGWVNQYSALTGKGFDGSKNYAIGYATSPSVIDFTAEKAHAVKGFFVTNSTFAGLSMHHGDDFTKKFGGEEGTDPDFLRLDVWGTRDGNIPDTISFYLADFRSEDSFEDYMIDTWQWVDLTSLGKVDSLQFALASSDVGAYGMNTPGYFCLDNLYVIPDAAPIVVNPIPDVTLVSNGSDTLIDLNNVFSDPDDGDDAVALSILSNSNEALLEATLSDRTLILRGKQQLVKRAYEKVTIVIEGISGALSVTDDFVVSLDFPSGVEMRGDTKYTIYPNPSPGSITIQTQSTELLEVSVVGMTGTLLYKNAQYEPGQSLDLSSLTPGPYMLRVRNDYGVIHKMIQKL